MTRDATVQIVVANGHAYSIVPTASVPLLMTLRQMRNAEDCGAKCWRKYVGSAAQALFSIVKPSNPILRSYCSFIPSLNVSIRNFSRQKLD